MIPSASRPATAEDTTSARSYLRQVGEGLLALERLRGKIVQLLAQPQPDAGWCDRLEPVVDELLEVSRTQPDLALYYLINEKVNQPLQYSALHAMCCALMAALGASWLDWPADELRSLTGAALTMNLAMGPLQDLLARQPSPPDARQRELIRQHAQLGAQALEQAGVTDALWLQVVREHHTVHDAVELRGLEPEVRCAELLRRIDVYAARLSARKTRAALTSATAARGALLGTLDRPDEIGAAMLRVLGVYPPGAYVELKSGETGVVIERGEQVHTPLVAALRRDDGSVLLVPQARDTSQRGYAVRRGVDALLVGVHPGHSMVLKARLQLGDAQAPAAQAAATPG